ncbi:MAG: gliding motility protein GldM [Flavobacteriaceae bacterium]
MAGGKLTPRQKMINLMYLVFIAMMALNMSKEVLSAFGLMNERLEDSNTAATTRNQQFIQGLQQKATDNPELYRDLAEKARQIDVLASDFNQYIEDIKAELKVDVKDPKDYEVMDKSITLDNKFFVGGDKYSQQGQEFVDKVNSFRTGVLTVLGDNYQDVKADVESKFSTGDDNGKIRDREDRPRDWLEYHFKGFPMVASLTKLTQLQADVKTVESEILSKMLQGEMASQLSFDNYEAVVILDKSAFFSGEQVTGKIALGRTDSSTKPAKVILNGKELDQSSFKEGGVELAFTAGGLGDQPLKGEFIFMEDGKEKSIKIESNYVVVPRPNEATISADKMNSIYRGVDNPMTISYSGIHDNDVNASAPGLKKVGNGKYIWRPDGIQGEDAVVTVTGKFSDGTPAPPSKKTFKVRNIPAPAASLRGQVGGMRGNKNDLLASTINVLFPDFVFDVKANVVSFEVSVPGSARIVVQGKRFNAQAEAAINRASRGDVVIISNVKTTLEGASGYKMKDSTPFNWEIQ